MTIVVKKLLETVRDKIRLGYYNYQTEKTYLGYKALYDFLFLFSFFFTPFYKICNIPIST